MAGRWGDPSAFRADPAAAPAARPTGRQTFALLAVLLLVTGAVSIASYLIEPRTARAFKLFHGSLFLSDQQSPVAVDLASGKATLRLVGADKQVGVTDTQPRGLGVVPLDGRTLLLNRTTGEFNMVDSSGFVVKHDGGGVPLGGASGPTSALGVADGELAFIIRNSAGRADVFLVSQSTVESAIFATKAVKPRASTAITDGTADADPGGAVAADGALWMLVDTGSGETRTIRRLTVPEGSSAGAVLDSSDHGTVSGASAMATASGSDGTTAVGVATAGRIRIFTGGSATATVRLPAQPGVDRILPANNRGGRLAFLMHGTEGWSRVSVDANGSGLRGPVRITGVPAGARLAPPAYSRDALYTMDENGGRIYRIDADSKAASVPGAEKYPVIRVNGADAELTTFPDAEILARGSRVVFNSATHTNAVILFTDGSHAPRQIVKSAAVQVSASGGAEQLTRSTVNPGLQPGKNPTDNGSKPKPAPAEQVNNKIDCKTANQKPHVPNIGQVQAGSRSVTMSWTYPILDNQDCYPSTYEVSVKLLTNGAPQPPSSVRVQSQVGATITGLFPLTRYQLVVTAYINGQGTSSPPIQIQTGPEGPAAPTDLAVAADSSGNWTLNWNSCGTVQQGCVAAQSWTVTPSFCDSRGVSSPPPPITTTADPTSKQQPTVRYPGSDGLLGRGLQFVVTGSGRSQVPGTPSAKSACVYSWAPPNPAAISLTASTVATTQYGDRGDATATLHFTGNQDVASGGVGAQYTYRLSGGGDTRTVGPTTETSATFPNAIAPGTTYTVTATVAPPRHGSAAITVGPQQVTTSSEWPNVTISNTNLSASDSDPSQGTLTFQVNNLSSAGAGGERFDFANIQILCDNASVAVDPPGSFDPADGKITASVSGIRPSMYNTTCSLQASIEESPGSRTDPPFFGGTVNPIPNASVDMPQQDAGGLGGPDFSAAFDSQVNGAGLSVVDLTVRKLDPRLLFFTRNWAERVTDGKTDNCGSDNASGSTSIPVRQSCVQETGGSAAGWQVIVSWDSVLDGSHTVTVDLADSPAPPSYQPPCTVTAGNFAGAWTGTAASPAIQLKYTQNSDQLAGCQGWTYTVVMPSTATQCTQPDPATGDPTAGPINIGVTCTAPPDWSGWSVTVSYSGTAGDQSFTVPVDPTPPA